MKKDLTPPEICKTDDIRNFIKHGEHDIAIAVIFGLIPVVIFIILLIFWVKP